MKKKIIIYVFLILLIIATIFLTYYNHRNYNSDDYKIVYIVKSPTTTTSSLATYYSKYHIGGCDYMFGVPERVTLSYARVNGYGACPKCDPRYNKLEEVQEDTEWINILQFIVTICLYITLPICIKSFWNDTFTNRQSAILSIINSLLIFFVVLGLFNNDGLDNGCLGLMFIIINYFILKINKNKRIPTTKIC